MNIAIRLASLRTWLGNALPEGSLRARFARGAFWSVVGAVCAYALGMGAGIIKARLLGKVGFGELGMVSSTVGMFGVFAGLGLGLTATKHVAELRQTDPARAGRIIGLSQLVALASGGAMAVAVFFTAPWLADHTIKAPHLVTELQIGTILLFFNALIGVQMGALAGFEAFKTIATLTMCVGLASFPITVAAVWWGGLRGAVIALVVIAGVSLAAEVFFLRRICQKANVTVDYRGARREWRLIWRFSVPALLSGAMVSPVIWLANTMLVNQPDGYAHLGVFSAANQWRGMALLAGATIGRAILPILSSQQGRRSAAFQKVNILVSWMLGLLIAVPIICFPGIIGWLYGEKYAGRNFEVTLILVMCSTAILAYKSGLARALAAKSLMWWGALSNCVWAVLLLGVMVIGRFHGSLGMAVAYVAAYGINTLVFVPFYIRRGLAPRELMWSPQVLVIWLLLGGAVGMNFFGAGWTVRILAAAALFAVVIWFVMDLARRAEITVRSQPIPAG